MQTKAQSKVVVRKKRHAPIARAIKKFKGENEDIVQALDIMKRAQMVKNLRSASLGRYSYHSI